MEPRVSLITLGVADLDRALAFYRDGLGWTLSSASVEGDVAFIQLNGMALALWSRRLLAEDARMPLDEGWGGITLAQNHVSREAVDDAVAAAVRAGGTLLKAPEPTDWGGYSGYVADPDGHPWELAHNPIWQLDDEGRLTLPD
jgi:catechol 2,3-dioxygenase-like lactoylglutathione lyase family enzyme